jgi:hypothetical protein
MSRFRPTFWWRDSNMYLVFSTFISRPSSLLVCLFLWLHPVASITTILWVPSIPTLFSNICIITYYISTTCLGPYEPSSSAINKYIYIYIQYIYIYVCVCVCVCVLAASQGAIFLERIHSNFAYELYIRFSFLFFFSAVSMWWIWLLITTVTFSILSFYIKIKIN